MNWEALIGLWPSLCSDPSSWVPTAGGKGVPGQQCPWAVPSKERGQKCRSDDSCHCREWTNHPEKLTNGSQGSAQVNKRKPERIKEGKKLYQSRNKKVLMPLQGRNSLKGSENWRSSGREVIGRGNWKKGRGKWDRKRKCRSQGFLMCFPLCLQVSVPCCKHTPLPFQGCSGCCWREGERGGISD